jgi:hypothetical protein
MSYGVYYKYDGFINHMSKDRLKDARAKAQKECDDIWNELTAMCIATPPATVTEDGVEYLYSAYLPKYIRDLRDRLAENKLLIHHIDDCLDAMFEDENNVTEG